jgi:hypothetical protein
MADYEQPDDVDRRLRYFDGQFLREQDFIDEQHYHLDRERRLARVAHTAGVVEGLTVEAVPNAPKVTVAAGTALDGHGRLLVRVDAGEPVDLTSLVNRDGPVSVLLALSYSEIEAGAPQGGASPRWQEAPGVLHFLADATDLPAEEEAPRLARVVLHPEGTAEVDQAWAAARSGLTVRGDTEVRGGLTVGGELAVGSDLAVGGTLRVARPASFAAGIDGGTASDGTDAPAVASSGLQVTRDLGYDGTVRLDVINGATDFGRTNLVLTGRFQGGNDAWSFGTAARNSLVFARNEAETGQAVGVVGEEEVSLQLEGNTRALGVLTRDRGNDPALVLTQDGSVGVHTDQPGAPLDVNGDLAVRGGAAFGEVGRWTAHVEAGVLVVTIADGSRHNLVAVRLAKGVVGSFAVRIPLDTWGQWAARYTAYDNGTGEVGAPAGMRQQNPGDPYALFGNAVSSTLPPGSQPWILLLEVHHVSVVTT